MSEVTQVKFANPVPYLINNVDLDALEDKILDAFSCMLIAFEGFLDSLIELKLDQERILEKYAKIRTDFIKTLDELGLFSEPNFDWINIDQTPNFDIVNSFARGCLAIGFDKKKNSKLALSLEKGLLCIWSGTKTAISRQTSRLQMEKINPELPSSSSSSVQKQSLQNTSIVDFGNLDDTVKKALLAAQIALREVDLSDDVASDNETIALLEQDKSLEDIPEDINDEDPETTRMMNEWKRGLSLKSNKNQTTNHTQI